MNRTTSRPEDSGKLVWEEEDWLWTDGTTLNGDSYENWMTVSFKYRLCFFSMGQHYLALFNKPRKQISLPGKD